MEVYDCWPDTLFIIGTDENDNILAGGRLIFSPKDENRRLHFERNPDIISLERIKPNADPQAVGYAEFGAVVADPNGSEQLSGLILEKEGLKLIAQKALPGLMETDYVIGSVVPKNKPLIKRILREAPPEIQIEI